MRTSLRRVLVRAQLRRRGPVDGFSVRDLLLEAAHGIGVRPGRLILTVLGTVLGVGSLVATVGLAQTASAQVASQFDAVAATHAVVTPEIRQGVAVGFVPWDAERRLERVAGVEAVGAVGEVELDGRTVTTVPVKDPSAPPVAPPRVLAATPGLLDALGGQVVQGRWFDPVHDERRDRVVVLGSRVAGRLGVTRVDRQPMVFIGEQPYTIIGVVGGLTHRTDLEDAVLLPSGTARHDLGLRGLEEVHTVIAVGAGPVLVDQAPLALSPTDPTRIRVAAPTLTSSVRGRIETDIQVIFLVLGGVALLVGGVGIANVTLLAVRERIAEIGLRRALGARRRDVGRQFLTESVVIGLLGGLIGSALGVLVVVGVCVVQGWTPILDVRWVLVAPFLGGLVGLVAGTYPALKAADVEPITALRTSA